VTFAVTEKTSSGRVVWRRKMPVSREHRLSLTGSRWDIMWLSGREKTPTLCVIPIFRVVVMEKCCGACGDGEYYFLSGCLAWKKVGN
jgi:hypothetical protein